MRDLPTGTVTFLFTDIEGSTRLLAELGDRYPALLAEHHRLIRDAIARHGGIEVDTAGDAFFVAFRRATDAVAAARTAQEVLRPTGLKVRMGIHTGEPLLADTGYVGMDVHRAARVMAAGHGGQVLVSQTTRELLDSSFDLTDLGEHRLKDLSAPQRLWQLGAAEFPRLKTLYQTNLPVQPTPLVGRGRELEEAAALLRSHRLLTLLGPGGSGKTRLALQLAAEATDEFADGVFWVPLQAVSDPAVVPAAIALAVGAPGDPREFLAGKEILLLLDNFEQLLAAAGEVTRLLAETTGVTVLATSREPLRLAAEQRYPVDPLPEDDAATLFVDRARAVDPAFRPTPAVVAICRRLDGLPLALELAAARVSLLTPEALLERLERALPLLTGGSRDLPERQRTLRATIAWSYGLLTEEEQRVLVALSVFAGSFDLDAAVAVCDAELDTIQSLVDKSLLRRWGSGRFGMLETIHEFARERLAADEATVLGRRHAEHYLDVARSGNFTAEATVEDDPELARREAPNFRSALSWAIAHGEVELGLRLAITLEHFWVYADPFEAPRWLSSLLAHAEGADASLRAAALRCFGGAVYIVGDFDRGRELYEQSLALYREIGDEWGEAHMLHRLAVEAARVGDIGRARELSEDGLAFATRVGDRKGEALALSTLAQVAEHEGRRDDAIALLLESATAARDAGFTWWEGGALLEVAELSEKSGRLEQAAQRLRESLAISLRLGNRQGLVYGLAIASRILGREGRFLDAGFVWGALEAEEERGPVGQWEDDRPPYVAGVAQYRTEEFERGRVAGRVASVEEAVRRVSTSASAG